MLVPVLGVAAALTLSYLWNEDFFWYLSSGRYLLEHRAFPAQDPFLYTSQSVGWVYHSWLWTVLIAVLDRLGGLGAVVIFHALVASALCVVVYSAGRVDRLGLANALVTTLLLTAVGSRLCGKAEVATWLLLAVFYRLLDADQPFDWKRGALLCALQVLWANLHGGYPLGVFIALCYSAGPWLAPRLGWRGGARAGRQPPLWFPAVLLLLAIADPRLYRERLAPFAFLADSASVQPIAESGNVILEWQSPFRAAAISNRPLVLFSLSVVVGLASFAAARKRAGSRNQTSRLLFFLGMAALAATAVRHLPGIGLAAALVALGNLGRDPAPAPERSRNQRSKRQRASAPAWFYPAVCALTALGLLAAALALRLARPGFEAAPASTFYTIRPGIMTPGAARLVLEQGLPGPIFNDYLTGAYLGAQLYPRQRVFVDGRVLDPGLVVRYTRMVQSEEAWKRAETEFGFRTAILGNYSKTVRSPLGNALMRDPAWRLALLDPLAVVFVKGGTAPQSLPSSDRTPFLEPPGMVGPLPLLQRLFLEDFPANYLVEYLAILGQFGRTAELVEIATRALAARPQQPLVARQRCAGNLVLRALPEAVADCALAYRHRPDDPQVVALYATVLRESGNRREAIAIVEQALARRRDPILEGLRRQLRDGG